MRLALAVPPARLKVDRLDGAQAMTNPFVGKPDPTKVVPRSDEID